MAPIYLTFIASLLLASSTFCEQLCLEGCKCEDHPSEKLGPHLMIDCSNLGSSSVPRDLNKFQNYGRPMHLKLSKNIIARVSKADFPENLPIIALDFNQNRGVMITDDAFMNIKGLRYLGLNDISMPFTDTMKYLKGMTKLRYLYLNKNYQFGEGLVPVSLFSGLELKLKDLSLHDCYLKGIENGALANVVITGSLDIGANQLDHIPEEVKTLKNLTKLDVSQNSIKSIPSNTFEGMSKLRTLSLSNNYINGQSFKTDSFNGLKLKELRLEKSELNTIPSAALSSLSSLKILKLNNSPIKTIPKHSFNGSYCLEVLDLTNVLVEIENTHLDGLESCLQKLYLNNMQIREIPKFFKDFKVLNYVSLSGNSISEIKMDDLVGTTITELDLTENPLHRIEKGSFEEFPHAISLIISDTRLSNLSFVRDYEYGTIKTIKLGNVLPMCDCELAFAEYRVLEIHGNCNFNNTKNVAISTDEFMSVTSHCWPDGKMPQKKDVWAVVGDNSAGTFSTSILSYFCVFLFFKVLNIV
ncbi:hypothetical protein LOTGIDRAFT_171718 [Lottia gigantea]|uniref:LRRNT domain-containing protein n=1 Tax=Lottia gigantea TaxID=225164 RepID=V4AZG5_LOTGI|nr:hypothetical protein LOTGIDRAFT_171718 [Lottia gigantea]ESP03113.1 hypothetical protein LOTGIDRAFT_171718 [Lottia gigantea]